MIITNTVGSPTGLDFLDFAITVFWILLGAALCFYAHDLGLSAPTGPDSGFFLMIAGVLLTLSGVGVLVSIVTVRDTESEPFFQNSDNHPS